MIGTANGLFPTLTRSFRKNGRTAAALLGMTAMGGCGMFDRSETMVPTVHGDVFLDVDRAGPQKVRVGEEFAYTIRVENTTNQPLHNVVVHEMVSGEGYEIVRASPEPASDRRVAMLDQGTGGWYDYVGTDTRVGQRGAAGDRDTERNARTSWDIGYLAPGESQTIRVNALADRAGDMRSCMMVDYDLSVCMKVEAVAPELSLTRSASAEQYYACDPIELTYNITNTGTAATRPGVIEESLPGGLRTADGNNNIRINVGSIEPGDTVERKVTLRAGDALTYDSRARLRSGDLSVQSSASEIRVLKPELELEVDGPGQEYLNRSIANQITVRNVSDDPAKDVMVSANLPEGFSNLSVSSQRIERAGENFLIGDLAAGESRTFTLSFDAVEPGTLQSTYTLTGHCVDEQVDRVRTSVRGIPAVRLEVIDKVDPVSVSENTVYEISVKNQGSAEGLDIRLTAPIPDGMEFVRVEGDRAARLDGNFIVFEPIPELAPGETHTWDLYMRALNAGRTRFEIRMENAVTRSPIIEQEATTIID